MSLLKLGRYAGGRRRLDDERTPSSFGARSRRTPFWISRAWRRSARVPRRAAGGRDAGVDWRSCARQGRRGGRGLAAVGRPAFASCRRSSSRTPRPKVRLPQKPCLPVDWSARRSKDDRYTPTRLVDRLRRRSGLHRERLSPERPHPRESRRLLLENGGGRPPAGARAVHRNHDALHVLRTRVYRTSGCQLTLASSWTRFPNTESAVSTVEPSRTMSLFPKFYASGARLPRVPAVTARTSSSPPARAPARPSASWSRCSARSTRRRSSPRSRSRRPVVRALILYPDERAGERPAGAAAPALRRRGCRRRVRRDAGGRFPRFGMYTGRTPYPGTANAFKDGERVAPLLEYYLGMDRSLEQRLRRLGRYPAKDLELLRERPGRGARPTRAARRLGRTTPSTTGTERLHTGPGTGSC